MFDGYINQRLNKIHKLVIEQKDIKEAEATTRQATIDFYTRFYESIGRSPEEIERDINNLKQFWVEQDAKNKSFTNKKSRF